MTQTPLPPVESFPFPELKFLLNTYQREGKVPTVFCMGDSVWERLSNDDIDQRNIGQLLQDALKHKTEVAFISHSAYNLRIYLNFIKVLKRTQGRPSYVVLPINLRSFSPQWFLSPLWQFERENQVLQEYYLDPKMDIPVIEPVVERPGLYDKFDQVPVHYPLSEFRTIREFRKVIASVSDNEEETFQRSRQIFIFHYMYPLTMEHPLLKYLKDALQELSEMNVKGFVYITPVNYQAGVRFCGEEFSTQVLKSIDLVQKIVRPYQVHGMTCYIDYSMLLGSEFFFNQDNATEHLNENGRKILVKKMAQELISFMTGRKGE